jgi:DNA invertase Pin-like site-specific DNA recombinase
LGHDLPASQNAHGRLLLTVLGGLAEFERELIRARTGEGRRRAVEAGVKLGRRSSLTPHQQAEVVKRRADGETLKALAKSYGVAHPTIMRTLRKVEAPFSAVENDISGKLQPKGHGALGNQENRVGE